MTENVITIIVLVICLGLYLAFIYFVLKFIWIIIKTLLTVITPNQAREFIDKLINLNDIKDINKKDRIKETLMFEYKYHDLYTYKDIENKFKELISEVK